MKLFRISNTDDHYYVRESAEEAIQDFCACEELLLIDIHQNKRGIIYEFVVIGVTETFFETTFLFTIEELKMNIIM